MEKKYNILISANHCAPGHGSEHGIGWNFVSRLARFHQVTLMTNRHIYYDELLPAAEALGIKVISIKQYVKYKGWTKFFPFIYYAEYRLWQYRAYRKVKEIVGDEHFDIIHHVTNLTFREPGYLWKLGIPFVWGPVIALGGEPLKFMKSYGFMEGAKMLLRRQTFKLQYAFPGRIRQALNAAEACLSVCKETEDVLRHFSPGTDYITMTDTAAIDENIREAISERRPDEEIRLLWLSQFDPRKGVMFLLKALQLLPDSVRYKLTLAGDGLQRAEAVRYCEDNKLNYEYIGNVPYREIQGVYDSAHLFFLTSMMDATTSVVFEALSRGLPVVALDHLSFGEVIDGSCGHKIKVGTQEQISRDIAGSIAYYYENENVRRKDAFGALAKAKEHSWDSHIKQLNGIYDRIIARKSVR